MAARKPGIKEMGEMAKAMLEELVEGVPLSVVNVTKEAKEWLVLVDVLERKAIPDTDDIIGRYEVKLDETGEVLGFKRITQMYRDALAEKERGGWT